MEYKKTIFEGVDVEVKKADGKLVVSFIGDEAVLGAKLKALIPGEIDDFLIDLAIKAGE